MSAIEDPRHQSYAKYPLADILTDYHHVRSGVLHSRVGTTGEVVAVDGKAICSTTKAGNPHSALQILRAYMTSNGVILAQESIHKKTNEIPVFQEMLTYFEY